MWVLAQHVMGKGSAVLEATYLSYPAKRLTTVKEYASTCDTLHECAVSRSQCAVQLEFWNVIA